MGCVAGHCYAGSALAADFARRLAGDRNIAEPAVNVDDLIIALEGKRGDAFLVELSTRVYQPPLSLLLEGLLELPTALIIPMLVIKFNTELHMSGIHGFLENNTGYYLSETIEALEAIGAHETARTMGNIRAILVRHGVDLSDRESIQNFHWDHWQESERLRAEIQAEADNLAYAAPRAYELEDVFGMLRRYVDANRDGLLLAIRSCASRGARP
jgi:hypothetical protein